MTPKRRSPSPQPTFDPAEQALEAALFAMLELALLPKARFLEIPAIELQVDGGTWNLDVSRRELFLPGPAAAPVLTLAAPTKALFGLLLEGRDEHLASVKYRGDLTALARLTEAVREPKSTVSVRAGRSAR